MRKGVYTKTLIKVNEGYEAKTLEREIAQMMEEGKGIDNITPLIYTERKEGVRAEHNIRTDRFDLAVEAMDKVSASKIAKRNEFLKTEEDITDEPSQHKTTE